MARRKKIHSRKYVLSVVVIIILLVVLWGVLAGSTSLFFDERNAFSHMSRIVSLGPRHSGSRALGEVCSYIIPHLQKAGCIVTADSFTASTPMGAVPMANIKGVIRGSGSSMVIIAAHYESKYFPGSSFVGANDNASGTAILLELARVWGGRKAHRTVWFLFLDGEEAFVNWSASDSLYGSRHAVAKLAEEGLCGNIKAFILLDMLGDRTFKVNDDLNSTPWLKDLMCSSAAELRLEDFFNGPSMPVDDDHVPFLEAGVPSIDIIDFNYPYWHTTEDNMEHVCRESLGRAGRVVLRMMEKLDKMP